MCLLMEFKTLCVNFNTQRTQKLGKNLQEKSQNSHQKREIMSQDHTLEDHTYKK